MNSTFLYGIVTGWFMAHLWETVKVGNPTEIVVIIALYVCLSLIIRTFEKSVRGR